MVKMESTRMVDTLGRDLRKNLVSKITGIYKSEVNGIVIKRYRDNPLID